MSLLDTIKAFFDGDDWPVFEVDGAILRTGFEGVAARWECIARTIEEDSQVLFYSICPIHVPSERLTRVMEYITRANHGLRLGNFEMNLESGDVRFKTSIDVEGGELTFPLISQLVYPNVLMMDQYLPGILSIIYGNLTAREALEQVESLPSALA